MKGKGYWKGSVIVTEVSIVTEVQCEEVKTGGCKGADNRKGMRERDGAAG